MAVLLNKWEFKNTEVNLWKWVKKFGHQDFQILELGSPGTSWFWQLMQALICTQSFFINWQLPLLNHRKGENCRRKYFIINLHESKLPDPAGIESATSWSLYALTPPVCGLSLILFSSSPVACISDWATRAQFNFRYDWLCDIDIPREKKLNYLQTVQTLIRHCILRHLISTVCQLPFWGSPDLNWLTVREGIRIIFFSFLHEYTYKLCFGGEIRKLSN